MVSFPASRSARSAARNKRSISTFLTACAFSFPMRSKFSKVMTVADDKDLLVLHNALEERLADSEAPRELPRWIEVRVDFAPQRVAGLLERRNDVAQFHFADDHQVEVAALPLVPARDGAVDKRRDNP